MPDLDAASPADRRGAAARRSRLVEELLAAGREHSDVVVMFHAAVAEQLGLRPTETKTLGLLERHGATTPGELARLTGLAPASVTGLLDRLERRGLVRRTRDSADGRRQLVELDRVRVPEIRRTFDALVTGLQALYERYTETELEVLLRWHREVAAVQRAAIPPPGRTPPAAGPDAGPRAGDRGV